MSVFSVSHLVSLLGLQLDGKNNLAIINSTLWLLTLMVVISFPLPSSPLLFFPSQPVLPRGQNTLLT